MSDDEDFMSDAFLTMASNDPTHMVETYSQKRRKLVAQQREQAIIKPIKERVMERVQQGLDTRIDESNKGFKLLAKMGFKPGQALGNPETLAAAGSSTSSLPSTSSLDTRLVEPITINIKPNYKAGLGLDSLLKEKKVRMVETAHYKEKVGIEEFVHRKRKHVDTKLVAKDIEKARRIIEQLDQKKGIEENDMWPQPPQSSSSSLPLTNYETSSTTLQAHILQELEEEENEGGDGLENELKVVYAALDPQDFLALLLDYLKTTHTYCLYCACDYDTLEQLDKECPGSRDNH